MEVATDSGQEAAAETQPHGASFDASVAHPARIYNYWLGGKDNFAADRRAAQEVIDVMPVIAQVARSNRLFLSTAVHYLVTEAGIRQFLDIGTGLPTENNTHEVAQRVAPESRIVYVDNDPIVLSHARALLTSDPRGQCTYVDADAREVDKILGEAAGMLDFSQPVAVMMLGLLHFIPDADDPYGLTRRYMDAVPPGSYLAISHGSSDLRTETQAAGQRYNSRSATAITFRSRQEVTRFFTGLDLVPPGVSPLGQWALGATGTGSAQLPTYAALGRKPNT
jgi:O-methyltransferase involved in polyketide biosynthesis